MLPSVCQTVSASDCFQRTTALTGMPALVAESSTLPTAAASVSTSTAIVTLPCAKLRDVIFTPSAASFSLTVALIASVKLPSLSIGAPDASASAPALLSRLLRSLAARLAAGALAPARRSSAPESLMFTRASPAGVSLRSSMPFASSLPYFAYSHESGRPSPSVSASSM